MKKYLLITLGHNASAAFVDLNGKIIAYEQERLDGIKASSKFPSDAINEILKHVGLNELKGCAIRVSHWFDFTKDGKYVNKYITARDFKNLYDLSSDIQFVNVDFTHHDAHAWSALAFYNHYVTREHRDISKGKPVFTIVADGFGNNGEVISIYKSIQQPYGLSNPSLECRILGYDNSLGLMYQYATSFCGMKENQDEYKFLGYEAHIDSYFSPEDIEILQKGVKVKVEELINSIFNKIQFPLQFEGDVIDVHMLDAVREKWYTAFAMNLGIIGIANHTSFAARCAVAYYIQSIIEQVIKEIIKRFDMANVIATGGIFYNVKLNNAILKSIPGIMCVMPLAGDQGAALGFYVKETGNKIDFSSLCYGKRDMYAIDKLMKPFHMAHLITNGASKVYETAVEIAGLIAAGKIVNIVTGNMEFGPRALCHTSSVFLPTSELVAENNHNNRRNEVMPCAPIVKAENAQLHYDIHELDRVIGSNKFMICTHDYLKYDGRKQRLYGGVMHKKPLESVHTGRPQIITSGADSLMWTILDEVERMTGITMLVNTSFNAHGRPIAFDTKSILDNYSYQVERSGKNTPFLYVIL
jgi:predicted NodU family carbamoyl transferase